MKLHREIPPLFFGLFTGVFGALYVVKNDLLEFEMNLRLGDLSNALLAIFIAWIVSRSVQQSVSLERAKAELYVNELNEVHKMLTELESGYLEMAQADIAASLKRLGMRSRGVNECISESTFPRKVKELTDFNSKIMELRRHLTDTPVTQMGIELEGNSISGDCYEGFKALLEERKNLIGNKINEIEKLIFKAKVAITSC